VPERDQVFVSYSHRDAKWLDRLNIHLKPLIRQGTIDLWADTRIAGGMLWGQEINSALARAGVAVLLVTPNYLASDFIANHELPPLFEAASNEEVAVLWIAVSASLYEETPIVRYQAVNDPARPLDSLTSADLNKTLVEIAKNIKAKSAALAAARGGTEYFDVPYERNPFFSGRDRCIQDLRAGLLERGRAALCGLVS
jgi:internalin A